METRCLLAKARSSRINFYIIILSVWTMIFEMCALFGMFSDKNQRAFPLDCHVHEQEFNRIRSLKSKDKGLCTQPQPNLWRDSSRRLFSHGIARIARMRFQFRAPFYTSHFCRYITRVTMAKTITVIRRYIEFHASVRGALCGGCEDGIQTHYIANRGRFINENFVLISSSKFTFQLQHHQQ